jgi:hypothetical protein
VLLPNRVQIKIVVVLAPAFQKSVPPQRDHYKNLNIPELAQVYLEIAEPLFQDKA